MRPAPSPRWGGWGEGVPPCRSWSPCSPQRSASRRTGRALARSGQVSRRVVVLVHGVAAVLLLAAFERRQDLPHQLACGAGAQLHGDTLAAALGLIDKV